MIEPLWRMPTRSDRPISVGPVTRSSALIITRAASLAALAYLGLPSTARAHADHAAGSGESALQAPYLLAAAGLALSGAAIGGLWFWRRSRSGHAPGWFGIWAGGLLVLGGIIVGAIWFTDEHRQGSAASSQVYSGTPLDGVAPDFRLADQRGDALALSDLRGRVVVLTFLDPNCTDICPLTARHFRLVSERLGDASLGVAFLTVNANPDANSVEDVARATEKWQVDVGAIASWRFLTGSADELQAVWRGYSIEAGNPKAGKPGEVAHSPGVFVIDQQGTKRWYVSIPQEALLGAPWDGLAFDELVLQHVETLLD